MKKLFFEIRRIELFNYIIRSIILNMDALLQKSKLYWRISGVVELDFNGLRFFYYSSSDDGIVDTLFYKTPHPEAGELSLVYALARSSECIIDIGANTGLYSIVCSKANPKAKIFAIEPHPGNQNRLIKNISVNNLTNISILKNAVGDIEKEINFYIPTTNEISDTSSADQSFSNSTYGGTLHWKEISVSQITLNSLMNSNQLARVDAIKIDVEGYEINVFEGARSFFEKYTPIIICEIFLNDSKKDFFDLYMKDLGYQSYLCLRDGLLRLDEGLIYNYDGWNFVFAKGRTKNPFNSYQNIEKWLPELNASN